MADLHIADMSHPHPTRESGKYAIGRVPLVEFQPVRLYLPVYSPMPQPMLEAAADTWRN